MRPVAHTDLRSVLESSFPHAAVTLLDAAYVLLAEAAWAEVHREFTEHMVGAKMPAWLPHKGDCDDWAWLFRAWLIERNWQQSASRLPVALFYLLYTKDGGERHAITCTIIRRGEALVARPIEPQPGGGLMALSAAERSSATLLIG